jgi:hypothetical protein
MMGLLTGTLRAAPGPLHRATGPRLDDRHARRCAQRARGHPGRQPTRVRAFSPIYADPVRPANSARFVFLGPARHRILPRPEQGRQRHRRPAARRGRPPPTTGDSPTSSGSCPPAAMSPWPMSRPQRPDPHHRRQAHPQPTRRRPRPALRVLPGRADPSRSLLTYTAEPSSPTQDALHLLASWTATNEAVPPAASTASRTPMESLEERQERHVWRSPHMPFAARVLERVTGSPTRHRRTG